MATAHLLVGFIGSGKTTLAKKLERETGAVRFTFDEWMRRMFGPNPPQALYPEYFIEVEDVIWNRAAELLDAGSDVIVDAGFWTRESRSNARQRVETLGAVAKLYNVVCRKEVMLARTLERNQYLPTDSMWVDEPAFESLFLRYQPMQPDEKFTLVDGEA